MCARNSVGMYKRKGPCQPGKVFMEKMLSLQGLKEWAPFQGLAKEKHKVQQKREETHSMKPWI